MWLTRSFGRLDLITAVGMYAVEQETDCIQEKDMRGGEISSSRRGRQGRKKKRGSRERGDFIPPSVRSECEAPKPPEFNAESK